MIYVLIANNKIKMINTSPVKINEKICEIYSKDFYVGRENIELIEEA